VGRALRARSIPLLTDAALGPGRLPVAVEALGADLVVLSGHKFGGPKGIGVLHVRRRTRVEPILRGGLQEERLRPGTEHVAGAVGLAVALERAAGERETRAAAYAARSARFLAGLAGLDGWSRVGPDEGGLPGLLTIELDGVEGEAAMINLDLEGFAVATGSTCALGGTDPSPSLLAMGLDARRAASTVRVSFGEGSTDEDASRSSAALVRVVKRLRALAAR
jgi:cysteine desulfurase